MAGDLKTKDSKMFKQLLKERWDKLTDADIQASGGRSDLLLQVLQQKYNTPRAELEKELQAVEAAAQLNETFVL